MNDVLPKPFTKEGLLHMLLKHLGHLKKVPDGIEAMPPHSAPPMAHTSTAHSLKTESSPGHSPSTISNWQSPGGYPGISPVSTTTPGQYMQPVHTPTAYAMDHGGMQFPQPTTPLGAPSRQTPHRRQISEIGCAEELSNDSKRPRIYSQTTTTMNQMPRGRPG